MGVLVVVVFGGRVARMPRLCNIVLIDAAGLGAYAVVGMDRALAAGISLPGVVVVGMVNAVGGGILRDVLLNTEPDMFKPGTLDQALALIGCLLSWDCTGHAGQPVHSGLDNDRGGICGTPAGNPVPYRVPTAAGFQGLLEPR